MKKNNLLIFTMLLITQLGISQNETVTGVLLDINNKVIKKHPVMLGSVSPVTVKTDNQGIFSFPNVNLQDTLYVGDSKGLNPVAIPINGHIYLTIKSLKGNFDTNYLDEPDERLVRYLQQVERSRTRNLSSMRKEDIEKSGCRDVACLLRRFGGVMLAGENILMRGSGTTSFTGETNSALVILDGIPVSSGDILNLPPEDIEDITILKDASMYGVRGANGAVVVNTRKR